MKKVEHIGIAVRNLETANKLYQNLLGSPPYKSEAVEGEGVITSFFHAGDTKIELLSATGESSPIRKFIDKRGEGVHHIAFQVEDILAEMKRLKAEGFRILTEEPFAGADNKLVCFIHPESCNGVLVELCQERTR